MARKQTKRQKAALKGWATRRAREQAEIVRRLRFNLTDAKLAKHIRRLVRGWFP